MKKITLFVLFVAFVSSNYAQTTLGLYTERTVTSTQSLNTTFGSNATANNSFPTGGTDAGTDGGTEVYEVKANVDGTNTQYILNYNPRADLSSYKTFFISLKSSSAQPTVLRIQDASDVSATLDASTYGMVYDGNWHTLAVPLADFVTAAPTIDLTVIKNVFIVKSDPAAAGDIVASTYVFYIDDVYLSTAAASSTWTGTTSSEWNLDSNWSDDAPFASTNVTIPSGTPNEPLISSTTNASTKDLTVNSGAILTINSGGTLIVNGTSSGDVTYNRSLGTANWYLVSPPVSGETMTDMRANNTFDTGSGSNIGFAPYTTAADTWSYFTTSSTDVLSNGAGYSAKLGAADDISFTGSINTSDVDTDVSFAGNGFNLIGNPYTSHINSKTFLDANGNLDQTQLWVWNQASSMYEVKTNASAFILAPAQGFFVKANSGTEVTFAESNQVNTGGTFQKSAKVEVKLLMTNGQSNRFAKIYYLDNTTKGFDTGYEGEVFGGIPNSLDVFTNLVEENQGKKYQVQSLPNTDLEAMIVPVGITADAEEITFTAETMNLPDGLKVFLEDRVNNTFNELSNSGNYKVALNEKTDGIGRFYLHTRSSALNTDNVNLDGVSLYMTNSSTLRITGLSQGKTNIKLFNILGKKVLSSSFNTNGVQDISLPKLTTGIYLIQLETEQGKLNKKIILE